MLHPLKFPPKKTFVTKKGVTRHTTISKDQMVTKNATSCCAFGRGWKKEPEETQQACFDVIGRFMKTSQNSKTFPPPHCTMVIIIREGGKKVLDDQQPKTFYTFRSKFDDQT